MPKAGIDPLISLKQIKEKWAKERKLKSAVDVTNQIVVEHERQVARFGFINLFHESFMKDWQKRQGRALTLSDMNITDPFALQQKTLWIRYVRSGDGERCTQGVLIDSMGKIMETPNPEVKLDLSECFPQNA